MKMTEEEIHEMLLNVAANMQWMLTDVYWREASVQEAHDKEYGIPLKLSSSLQSAIEALNKLEETLGIERTEYDCFCKTPPI